MELWQRFSSDARKTCLKAHERARAQHRAVITAADLVLGMIEAGHGAGYERLQGLSTLPALVAKLEATTANAPTGDTEEVSFAPDTQRALTRAYKIVQEEEAAGQINTGHLLQGLVREADVGQMLKDAGLAE